MGGTNMVRVGPAGWSYDDWKGIVYPPGMPSKQHPLEFLCGLFDTIEVNVSYYRPVTSKMTANWVRRVAQNEDFRFTAKLWKRFTHERESWPSPEEVQIFQDGLAPLMEAGKLGALLVQFPWSFRRTPENRTWLARIVETFANYPLALEIRHASWNRPEVFDGLAQRGITFCNIDQPIFSNSLKPTDKVTARVGYVRLHGRNAANWFREEAGRNDRYNYLYSVDELKDWLRKVERIRESAEETYVITNNHYRGQAVVNALELQEGLGVPKGAPPASLLEAYPRLKGEEDPLTRS